MKLILKTIDGYEVTVEGESFTVTYIADKATVPGALLAPVEQDGKPLRARPHRFVPVLPQDAPRNLINNNQGTNPDQAQRLHAEYHAFLKRRPDFLVLEIDAFVRFWHEGKTYKDLLAAFPGITHTDVGAIRFGLNLPRRKKNYEAKRPEAKINRAREDTIWPGPPPTETNASQL